MGYTSTCIRIKVIQIPPHTVGLLFDINNKSALMTLFLGPRMTADVIADVDGIHMQPPQSQWAKAETVAAQLGDEQKRERMEKARADT